MFIPVSDEPRPYVLRKDRESEPPHTVFWLEPATADESTGYRARWQAENGRFTQTASARASATTRVDRDFLQRKLRRVENAFVAGDDLGEPEDLKRVVDKLDFFNLQELCTAVQSMAELEDSAKNS